MAAPLSPMPSSALNLSTPTTTTTTTRKQDSDAMGFHSPRMSNENIENSQDGSSPFMAHIRETSPSPSPATSNNGPNPSPKARPGSRIMSGSELSPLKILQHNQQLYAQQEQQRQQQNEQNEQQQQESQPQPSSATSEASPSPSRTSMPPPPLPQSPRKLSAPIKRFPVKVSPLSGGNESPRRPSNERQLSSPDPMRENEIVKHAIEIFEDENNMVDDADGDGADTSGNDTMLTAPGHGSPQEEYGAHHDDRHHEGFDETAGVDESMISNFSTFSAMPDLTNFAQMRSNSPNKFGAAGGMTPRLGGGGTMRGGVAEPTPLRTPRASTVHDMGNGNNTTNLMDFTDSLRYGAYAGSSSQPSPSQRNGRPLSSANRMSPPDSMATPQRNGGNLVNLLDFDIPPMPTPRSIPTITPRELESLKSNFLSEISSLKASLSGKEAEVQSLKTAVVDAEKRVGECLEQLREVEGIQESITAEKDSWERRGREMEAVLRKVREEIVLGQREREELEFKLDEAEKRREAAEMMAQDAESKMAGMRAGKLSAEAHDSPDKPRMPPPGSAASNKEVEMAVERVARELHALYKSKHETKVAALKKSYEGRWEKKVRELQAQVDELSRENDELRRTGRDASARMEQQRLAELEEERQRERARDAAQMRELEAEVEKIEAMMQSIKNDNEELREQLERERVEKGELVLLAEEMMNMAAIEQQRQEQMQEQMQQQRVEQREREQQMQEREREQEQEQRRSQEYPNPREKRRASGSAGMMLNGHGNNTTTAPMGLKTPARPMSGVMGRTPKTVTQANGGGHENTTNFRQSVRASGLRAPGGGLGFKSSVSGSRIGGPGGAAAAGHERNKSSASSSGMPRPGSGLGSSRGGNGIMSSIEKMGSYNSRGVRGGD